MFNLGARAAPFDLRGNFRGVKRTYRATPAGVLVAAAGNGLFFEMTGAANRIIRLQRIVLSGLTLTAVAYIAVELAKYSSASTGGTSTTPTAVPLDSEEVAAAAVLKAFTAAPTIGSLIGNLGVRRVLAQATTAAAAGIPEACIEWDFRCVAESEVPTLRGAAQGIGLNFDAAPATAVTLALEVEWTEETV